MQGAIVYYWTHTVPGREGAAIQLMRDTNAFNDKAVADGRISDYAWYFAAQGGLNSLIVRGEMEQLMVLAGDPEVMALNMRSDLVNEGYTWGYYATGDSAQAMAAMFEQEAAQLA